ncbi:hypothetical protein ABZ871_12270 [Streptomyces populi]
MNERRPQDPGTGERPAPKPVPRDLPDQQAAPDEDPWDVVGTPGPSAPGDRPVAESRGADEADTGREGTPDPAGSPAEHPVPDEPAD